jgi:hypothetical protein
MKTMLSGSENEEGDREQTMYFDGVCVNWSL